MKSLVAALAVATVATPAESGRLLYQFGEAEAPVATSLPGETVFSSKRTLACAACHGFDGSGSREIATIPDIAQVAGTAADPVAFRLALAQGKRADGTPLRVMPRYALSEAQRAALAAYILALAKGDAREPGVLADAVIVDASRLPANFVAALRSAAESPANEIYGRRLRFTDDGQDALIRLRTATGAQEPTAQSQGPINLTLDITTAPAAPATVRALATIVARAGRRLTRPGLAQIIERSGKGG